ncbi:glucosaminidase domain-containing protein [Peribacillus sp. Hz7]|uniref:glucosaminidase domain-containing protein n=1 Tax=Peribacillus sp. Hz7 TaxID=3344873 RepID=UPI0035CA07AA
MLQTIRNYFFTLLFVLTFISLSTSIASAATTLQGVALDPPTNVYEQTNTSSKVLKSYSQGTILRYQAYSDNWYKASVYISGKAVTGYIYKADVETATASPVSVSVIGLDQPTNVYTKASTSSATVKSYAQGTILKVQTFTSKWYAATVYVNGEKRTGYIYKGDVEKIVTSPEPVSGIGLKNPTNVYAKASTSATKLKSYAQGTILKMQTFTSKWYAATVYVKGEKKTGYIHVNDIEKIWTSKQQLLEGAALKAPTNVYSKASRNSSVFRSYTQSKVLKYRTFSENWYTATIYISGTATTGYIHKDDVKGLSYYNLTVDEATAMQVKVNPMTDESGSWKEANATQVTYYVEPTNFLANDTSSYQFLVLSDLAGTNATELNNALLNGKGILANQGEAFIEAAKTHGVNEIYLISHALLETGNGYSTLSNGVEVSEVDGKAVTPRVVYNMFGIGAKDSCALRCGSEYAYKAGWTTPQKAIIGGAQFIGNGYVNAGQDTLYKMRWNPAGMEKYGYATHQYATDIGWAVKQTDRIAKMYDALSTYNLQLDVTTYLPSY